MAAGLREDPALETLFLPFTTGRLAWPDRGALFLRARTGGALDTLHWPALVCEQTFKPDADRLTRAGYELASDQELAGRSFDTVLVLPPRQRDEGRALLARAVELTAIGGRVVASASNNEGARTLEADLARLTGPVETLTKNKCRAFWSGALAGSVDPLLLQTWLRLDAPRPIADGRFISRPGVFAWDRIDPASALLAAHLPDDLAGRAADLGAGFGYLSVELLTRCAGISQVDLYEAEARALELARVNLASFGPRAEFHWHDVTTGLPRSYDVIVMNPPFHTGGREDRPDIGRRFIQVAGAALRPRGQLWLVANRHLPYESVLGENFSSIRTVAQEHGFKIIAAVRA